ncbi:PD40 domain-containing protein [Pseudotamlana agarivorans]|uniref:PD40 domain-containing protein n=1 Tax=Pseudotamlana agarivorans TaxID=481183 RepID=UPI000829AD19|nr:PD40 domain-containing protein [Tamlana agarivorans]
MNRTFALLLGLSVFFGSFNLSQSQEKIFYSSFRPQGWDIYLSKDEGKTFGQFTKDSSLDYDAKISPDGRWIVFTSERLGRPHLFIKSTQNDSVPRLLVSSHSMQDQVDFSPDGKWIAFVSTHEGNAEIYKLPFSPLETLNIDMAVNLTNNDGGDFRPNFSNDGKKIAFSSDRAHPTTPMKRFVFALQRTGDIYTMNSDGSNPKRLTRSKNWDGSPVWTNDDLEIIFYSANNNESYDLFKIKHSGEDPVKVGPIGYKCLSPFTKKNGDILFTSFVEGSNGYSILKFNPQTKAIDSSLVQEMNMMNVDYHQSGIMVYHGGKTPNPEPTNLSDFPGDLLVKNSPEIITDFPDKNLLLYGVRHSFAAPPTPDGKIVYSISGANGIQDVINPISYVFLFIPFFAIVWFVVGVFKSVKKRKTITFWKYLLFSFTALSVGLFLIGVTYYLLFPQMKSLDEIKTIMLIIALVLLSLGIMFYYFFKNRRQLQKPIASLYKAYSIQFFVYALVLLCSSLFIKDFFNTVNDFYAVDYTKNEIEHLFEFQPDKSLNPQFSNIIDIKMTPDGQYLQFSVGGFRQNPDAKGAVYRYHFGNKDIKPITDLESNTGFADYSEDNKVMVYRSGRSGNMDIYVEENGQITNITNSPDKENFPAISYDGNKIVFCSDVNGVDKEGIIKTMDLYITERVEGGWSIPKQLTTYNGQEAHAHFSPDGKWLIYTTEEFGINDEQPLVQPYIFSPQMYGEITAIRLEDGEKIRLTHNKWEDGAPIWLHEK